MAIIIDKFKIIELKGELIVAGTNFDESKKSKIDLLRKPSFSAAGLSE
jgi:hypothetical protein